MAISALCQLRPGWSKLASLLFRLFPTALSVLSVRPSRPSIFVEQRERGRRPDSSEIHGEVRGAAGHGGAHLDAVPLPLPADGRLYYHPPASSAAPGAGDGGGMVPTGGAAAGVVAMMKR
ncbi:hypothetical protein ZWY2020_018235 [Hordeum vulgare]|nr:hypothetical protein ZWY2020_018235 [Hordeum vulgare]